MATPGSCQSALFYISNYMRKSIDKLSGIIPLSLAAVRKRKQYPSRADDAGSPSREAKYLSTIILNKLNAAEEVSDQIAASAVYGYDSFLSSHSFANLYVVDLLKWIKNNGLGFGDDAVELDQEDKIDQQHGDDLDEEIAPISAIGKGQDCCTFKRRLTEEEGGKIVVDMVRDLDDYLYRGPHFADLSPFTYKAVVSRVRKSEIRRRSSVKVKPGKRPHLVVPFCKEHPLSDTHVQRLRGKFSIIKFVGMQIPANPGAKPTGANVLPA